MGEQPSHDDSRCSSSGPSFVEEGDTTHDLRKGLVQMAGEMIHDYIWVFP